MLRYNWELQPLPSDNRAAAFHILRGMRGVVFAMEENSFCPDYYLPAAADTLLCQTRDQYW